MALRSKAASKTEYNSRPFTKSNLAGRSFCLGVMPIPCPHFKITIVKRSQGQSAVAGAAYQSGERLFSEYDQRTKFYNKKKELVHAEIMLPSYAPPGYADRATLWNAVEAVENQWNSQLARRIVLAFPVEVPKEQYALMKNKIIGICPNCGANVVEREKGWFCENRECRFVLWKDNAFFKRLGKRLDAHVADKLLRDGRVRLKDCKSAKGKTYNATVLLSCEADGRSKFSLEFEGGC